MFDVTPYIQDVVLLPRRDLKLDSQKSGNPRTASQGWVDKLTRDFLANPPAEVNVTTWEDPGA